jgi:hypothetical protein
LAFSDAALSIIFVLHVACKRNSFAFRCTFEVTVFDSNRESFLSSVDFTLDVPQYIRTERKPDGTSYFRPQYKPRYEDSY